MSRWPKQTWQQRFWSKVALPDEDGCMLWLAARSQGYGTFQTGTGMARAHRVAYGLLVGPIPDGLVLDHLCRVRHCVAPAHLEPVTAVENSNRGAGLRTHCPQGHAYEDDNVLMDGKTRKCRTCCRRRDRERRPRGRERVAT